MSNQANTSKTTLILLIEARQQALNKSNDQIAQDLGFAGCNVITLMKQGRLRLPLRRLADLCDCAGC